MIDKLLSGKNRPANGVETVSETELMNNWLVQKLGIDEISKQLQARHITIRHSDEKYDEWLIIDNVATQHINVPSGARSPEELIWQAKDKASRVISLSEISFKEEEVLVVGMVQRSGYPAAYVPKYGLIEVPHLFYLKWLELPGFCLTKVTRAKSYRQLTTIPADHSEWGYLANYKLLK